MISTYTYRLTPAIIKTLDADIIFETASSILINVENIGPVTVAYDDSENLFYVIKGNYVDPFDLEKLKIYALNASAIFIKTTLDLDIHAGEPVYTEIVKDYGIMIDLLKMVGKITTTKVDSGVTYFKFADATEDQWWSVECLGTKFCMDISNRVTAAYLSAI